MANVAVIEAALRLDGKQWERTIKKAKSSFQTLITDTRAQAAAAGTLLLGAGVGLARVATELKSAGDEALRLRKNLDVAFDGEQLDRLTEKIRVLGATPPFTEDQFTGTAKELKTFRKDVEPNLERIGNLAISVGKDFGSISKAFSAFTVDPRATAQLEKLANITPERLKEYGALVDDMTGKLILTGDGARRAQQALEKLVDKEYTGAMDAAVTATDQLNGSIQLLKQDAGVALAQLSDDAAGFVLPLVEGFRALPAPVKASAGLMVAFGVAAAGATAATIALGLAAGPLTAGFAAGAAILKTQLVTGLLAAQLQLGGLQLAANAANVSLATLAVTIGVVAVAAAGLHLYTKEIEANTKAQEDLLRVELQRAANQRKLKDIRGKSVQELREEGKTAKDVANSILALQEQFQQAGDKALAGRIKAQIIELKSVKEELAKLEADDRAREAEAERYNSAEAVEERRKAQEKAAEEERQERAKALQEELHAIELRRAKEEITEKQALDLRAQALEKFKADEEQKRALILETARYEAQALKDAKAKAGADQEANRKKLLQDELDRIDLLRVQRRISAQDEVNLLKSALARFKTTEEEKRAILRETATLEAQIAGDAAAEVEKANKKKFDDFQANVEKAKQEATDLQNAQAEAGRIRLGDLDSKIGKLVEETTDTGKDNTAEISRALQEQLKIQLEQIRLEGERAAAATTSAEARAQIEANTQAKMRQEAEETRDKQIDIFEEIERAQKDAQDRMSGKSTFGTVFDLSQLNDSISSSLSATNALKSAQIASPQGFNQLQLLADQLRTTVPSAELTMPRGYDQKAPIEVELDVNVNVDAQGNATAEAKVTSIDGRGTNITKNARGMPRGRGIR